MDGEGSGAVDVLVYPDRLVGVDVKPLHRVARVVGACNICTIEKLRESSGMLRLFCSLRYSLRSRLPTEELNLVAVTSHFTCIPAIAACFETMGCMD